LSADTGPTLLFRPERPCANLTPHGIAKRQLRFLRAVAAGAALVAASALAIGAEPPGGMSATPAWPTSPFHGVIDGAGKRIPCRCRYQGGAYRLGDTVCMNTHLGVQLARCDLFLNNTSWVPTGTPCALSRIGPRLAAR
jgi:hypothetical protein